MGYKRFCDATRELEKADGTFEEFGQVIKRQYAPDPAKDVKAFYAARDELHERIAAEFKVGLEELTEVLLRQWPEIYLPDETDEVAEKRIATRLVSSQGSEKIARKKAAAKRKRVERAS